VEFNQAARLATYRLGDFGAEKITPESLDKTALHELLHVFLMSTNLDPPVKPQFIVWLEPLPV